MSLSQSFSSFPLVPAIAPPALAVRALAVGFGCAGCGLRFSSRSYSGVVVSVRFPSRLAARLFAPAAARLACVPVKVRGLVVAVPVAPFSRVVAVQSLRGVL